MVWTRAYRRRDIIGRGISVSTAAIIPAPLAGGNFALHVITQGMLAPQINKAIQGFDDDDSFDSRWIP